MPNYVDNFLIASGPDAAAIAALVKSDERECDFNRITPQPPELESSQSSSDADIGLCMLGIPYAKGGCDIIAEVAGSFRSKLAGSTDVTEVRKILRRDPRAAEYEEAGLRAAALIAATGYANQRDWRIDHWGTKWNAMESGGGLDDSGNASFGFRTAWDPPLPIIAKLSLMFPASTFRLEYVDEYDDCKRILVFKSGCVVQREGYDAEGEPHLPKWDDIRAEVEGRPDGDLPMRT